MKKLSLSITFILLALGISFGQQETKLENRVSLVFGTNQLLLGGFNIEGNLFYKHLAFDYSHGVSLNLDNEFLIGSDKEQGLAIHIPFTTGFGVGYRFNDWFNVRAEPKWHKIELFYDGETQSDANMIASYTTFSLGLGAYATWLPFKNKENFLKGITIAPSIRYWPKVADSIDGTLSYENSRTQQTEEHEAIDIGIANTPWILNVSIGYSLTF